MPERGSELDEAGHVRGFAARRHVVQDVRVRAVEEEADDMARPFAGLEHVGEHLSVLHREVAAVGARRATEERGNRRRDDRKRAATLR